MRIKCDNVGKMLSRVPDDMVKCSVNVSRDYLHYCYCSTFSSKSNNVGFFQHASEVASEVDFLHLEYFFHPFSLSLSIEVQPLKPSSNAISSTESPTSPPVCECSLWFRFLEHRVVLACTPCAAQGSSSSIRQSLLLTLVGGPVAGTAIREVEPCPKCRK